MDAMWQEIGIGAQHVCESTVTGRFQLICDKEWLQALEQRRKIAIFPISPQLDQRAHPADPLEHPWTRILVQAYRKQSRLKVFPLPTPQGSELEPLFECCATDLTTTPLTYSQAVAYVANTNFKNLWESSYRRYHGAHIKFCKQQQMGATSKAHGSPNSDGLVPYDQILKEVIQRIFHCPIIHSKLDRIRDGDETDKVQDAKGHTADCHTNILPAIAAVETTTHICVFFYPPAVTTSLYDCITYSPSVLNKSYNKALFMIYQLFQVSKALQACGLFLGDVRLQDIYLRDNLWLQVIPRLEANILQSNLDDALIITTPRSEGAVGSELNIGNIASVGEMERNCAMSNNVVDDENDKETEEYSSHAQFDLKFAYDLKQFSLREYCEMWCNGQLSNYDYLTILNNASGRTLNNPAYHHIMPWVTDLSNRNGSNWRDLTKSKYRLNKGDVHLDLMFQQAGLHQNQLDSSAGNRNSVLGESLQAQVPHHVSDFLSEITYFVYMARRTPQHILREHVRPIWVPAEYPVSIQRLQEWTPDECIPEFYSDPMIFKSIHEDLPDLELPTWATCPEDFVCKHREALESQYVSERLQHWIDLNFGYKLSGKAAIKAKNVCLSMVDQHKNLCKRGIVQLFNHPHPPKRFPSPWFGKTAPRINHACGTPSIRHGQCQTHDLKRLTKSTENLRDSLESIASNEVNVSMRTSNNSPRLSLRGRDIQHPSEDLITSSASSFYQTTNFIELPKDYNPCALLQSLETQQHFFARAFPKQKAVQNADEKMISSDLMFDQSSEENSYTNQLFVDGFSHCTNKPKTKNLLAPNMNHLKRLTLLQLLTEKRERELHVLGCLIVELFAMQRLRPLLTNVASATYEERLQACRTILDLHKQDLPKCLRPMVRVFLSDFGQQLVNDMGLPPPNAAQILEPIFSNLLVPFPPNYYAVYALIRSLQAFDFDSTLLELHTHFQCNGQACARYTEVDRQRVLFERKIAECKVMSCCAHIGRRLLEPAAYEQFSTVELLLPHIVELLNSEQTSILSAWNLFDPMAQALGVVNTQKHLLLPILKLYDVECFERGIRMPTRGLVLDSVGSNSGQLRFSTSSSFKSRKSVKLYHHSFLLRLIVRFGLNCFLQHFIAALVEAVGGYKEPEDGNGFHYHSNRGTSLRESRRTSRNLNYAAADAEDNSTTVTMMSAELDDNTLSVNIPGLQQKSELEDVFTFDDDGNSDRISNAGTGENKSVDSFDMRGMLAPAEEAKEDYLGQRTPEKLAISELIYGSRISTESLDDADKISLQSHATNDATNDSPTMSTHLGPKSPTIEIPTNSFRRTFQLNTIDCDIGSRKSVDSFEIITQAVEEEQQRRRQQRQIKYQPTIAAAAATIATPICGEANAKQMQDDADDSLQASVISKMSEAKALQNNRISEMSAESLIWLSHRLGPVLTSRYIARNLLKMLSLCYVGQENLLPDSSNNELQSDTDANDLNYFSVADAKVVGDRSASRVLQCLMSIAALYGEELILLQYFPHISELIALSCKRITCSLEGAIISTLQLLKYLIPCLTDATIMENLKEKILDSILLPIIRLLSSARLLMPSGYLGRSVLARKLLDAIYALCVRIGPDMSKEHLCIPTLRPFFLIFDKAYDIADNFVGEGTVSPPSSSAQCRREHEEIRDVFSPALAHTAYLAFLRFLGDSIMQRTLMNLDFILALCHEFEQPEYNATSQSATEQDENTDSVDCPTKQTEDCATNSFGTQVIGNRIEVAKSTTTKQEIGPMEVLDMVAYKFEHIPTARHLKGNWLAYWRHEISRPDKETMTNLKQIKLQSFAGHTNSVRAILALDNENSFISASKDKTVKLWSLRSEGDGKKTTACQFTYTGHKKSIHSLSFLDSLRYVVSCDSGVHVWDILGRPLGILDAPKHNPITVVKCLPSPSPLIVCGTAESTVKIIDSRCMQYVNEWRVSAFGQSNATVRCLAVAPSGNWLAAGLSSGSIVMVDTRTGMLLNSWRPMECDLLQLAAPNDQQLVSSALDHSLAVWHANNGILHYQLRPPAEPAHFLQTIGSELVFATTGNRIGVYSDLTNSHAAYTVTKLRSETFRGVLTSLAVLPLNRALLAGNESGNIVLLC